jgi:N-acetylneuraminic acid mutarotase
MKRIEVTFQILFFLSGFLFSFPLRGEDIRATLTHSDLTPGQSDTFSLSRSTGTAGSCSGTMTENYSGITTLAASSCDGAYSGQAGTRHGFRFDNFHIFRGFLNANQIVTAASNPSCPSSNTTYNYLLIRGRSPTDYGSDAMNVSLETTFTGGVLNYITSSSGFQSSSYFSLQNLNPGTSSFNLNAYKSFSCNAGSLKTESDHSTVKPLDKFGTWSFGNNSALYTSVGGNPRLAIAVPQVALSSATQASKAASTYTGLLQSFNSKGNQTQEVVYAAPNAAGTSFTIFIAKRNTNNSNLPILNNSDEKDSFGSINCSTLNSPAPGFCQGTLTLDSAPGKTGNAVCLFAYGLNQKDLIFCNAQRPHSSASLDNKSLITLIAGTSSRSVVALSAAEALNLAAGTSSGNYTITVKNLTPRSTSLALSTAPAAPFSQPNSLSGTASTANFTNLGTCGTTLPAFSSCTLNVAYSPPGQQIDTDWFRLAYQTGLPAPNDQLNATASLIGSRGLSSISVTGNNSFTIGSASTVTATANFANGSTQNITSLASFSSATTATANVSSNGAVSPLAVGSTNFTASFAGFNSANRAVTVYNVPVNPSNPIATVSSSTQMMINWSPGASGGSGNRYFQMSYQVGATAPADCNSGTVVAHTDITVLDLGSGYYGAKSIDGLTPSTQYSFRICGRNMAGSLSSGVTVSASTLADLGEGSWTAISTTGAPAGRGWPVSVWTGSKMIVWGGGNLSSGGLYDPVTDSWSSMTTTGAPTGRYYHTAVWTGTEMIVWGGVNGSNVFNSGGKYNPTSDTWTATSTTSAPAARQWHAAVWTGSKMIVWGGVASSDMYNYASAVNTGGVYDPNLDTWTATSTTSAPAARHYPGAVWTGSKMIVWGGNSTAGASLNTGGLYDPTTDSWSATATSGAASARPAYQLPVWTGSKMIIWGWHVSSGGLYDPSTNTWSSMSTTNQPCSRRYNTWTWTGSKMVVWGGAFGDCSYPSATNTGGQYDPVANTWIPTSTTNAPSARQSHTAVWTGTHLVVWGGTNDSTGGSFTTPAANNPTSFVITSISSTQVNLAWSSGGGLTADFQVSYQQGGTAPADCTQGTVDFPQKTGSNAATAMEINNLVSGTQYSFRLCAKNALGRLTSGVTGSITTPVAQAEGSWVTMGSSGAPAARFSDIQVWTGSKMIIWGGFVPNSSWVKNGGIFDPVTNSWSTMNSSSAAAPSARSYASGVWTDAGMIVWGGRLTSDSSWTNTGAIYNPTTDTWSTLTTTNAPAKRALHVAVSTGSKMIIWGGTDGGWPWDVGKVDLNTGGVYDTVTQTWSATSLTNAPSARAGTSAVWTGSKMIIWGGNYLSTGGSYDPSTNTWSATTTTGAPSGRIQHTAVWTGTQMIVWGGYNGGWLNTGGVYTPSSDSWSATTTTNAPTARTGHYAVWSGTQMIIWGGSEQRNNATLYKGSGSQFNPSTNSWAPTSGVNAPVMRNFQEAYSFYMPTIWTGTQMIIWGGKYGSTYFNSGAMFTPTASATAPTAAPTLTGYSSTWANGSGTAYEYDFCSTSSVSVTFTPGGNGGSAITNYQWSLGSWNGSSYVPSTWNDFSPAQTGSSVPFSGLSDNNEYFYFIRAKNTVGTGPTSSLINLFGCNVY